MKAMKKKVNFLSPPLTGDRGELLEILWKHATNMIGAETYIPIEEMDSIVDDILALQKSQEEEPDNIMIDKINSFQHNDKFHPLTCGNDSNHRVLEAVEREGKVVLVCSDCDYEQKYIPKMMFYSDQYLDLVKKQTNVNTPFFGNSGAEIPTVTTIGETEELPFESEIIQIMTRNITHLKMVEACRAAVEINDFYAAQFTGQKPTDDEIEKEADKLWPVGHPSDFIEGAKWARDKIISQNKLNQKQK